VYLHAGSQLKFASEGDIEYQAHISHLRASQVLEDRNKVEEFIVMSVRKPTTDRYSMLGVENVRSWRVVDNDGFLQISTNLGQIFDVVSLVIITTFSEKSVVYHVVDI
jgi:hypothetical protein